MLAIIVKHWHWAVLNVWAGSPSHFFTETWSFKQLEPISHISIWCVLVSLLPLCTLDVVRTLYSEVDPFTCTHYTDTGLLITSAKASICALWAYICMHSALRSALKSAQVTWGIIYILLHFIYSALWKHWNCKGRYTARAVSTVLIILNPHCSHSQYCIPNSPTGSRHGPLERCLHDFIMTLNVL